ncbi:hypothetical protein CCYA_CCYA04G1183 [Cyanidiococcus yangmingshanensis]|nr:hypothetical protein CCYA_CCYA04G1183 [Cyanidiococcus yangmingshanensis]
MSKWETNLKRLRLKRAIREPHNEDIRVLERNTLQPAAQNMIVSLSSEYCFVYDNEHLGPNLDLYLSFRSWDGDKFTCCCFVLPVLGAAERAWLERHVPPSERSQATPETLLVVGGQSGRIRVLSVAEATEVLVLSHENGAPLSAEEALTKVKLVSGRSEMSIRSLSAHPSREGVFSSASGASVCVWQLLRDHRAVQLLYRIRTEMTASLALSTADLLFVASQKPAEIREWSLKLEVPGPSLEGPDRGDSEETLEPKTISDAESRLLATLSGTADVLRCGPRGLVVKSADALRYLAYSDGADLWKRLGKKESLLKLPAGTMCGASIDIAIDEGLVNTDVDPGLVCVGTENGAIHVYRLENGEKVVSVSVPRLRHQMGGCAFGHNGESLVAAHAHLLYRFTSLADDSASTESLTKSD